jgi:hypothetical protein
VTTDRIVAFYAGGPDDQGRTLEQILGWSDHFLEVTHDYIQWVFPTRSMSAVNPSAPLVTGETIAAFAARLDLRARLARSLNRMESFYGLQRGTAPPGEVRIEIDALRFTERAGDWLRPHNHNHLRLTRIMESLATLGLSAEAKALQRCLLTDVYQGPGATRITHETAGFWRGAC